MRRLIITPHHHSLFQLQQKPLIQSHEPPSGSEALRAVSRIQAPRSYLRHAHKTHYRIVFKEKGITVDCMKSFRDVMTILTGAVSGAFLHGMVHLQALTLPPCSFTAVAKVRMGAPRCECREHIIMRRACQAMRFGICEENW
jgi:hypothetical protein